MSYKKTMEGVRYLIQNELDMASEINGEHFNSAHEAYAVIKEEREELSEEQYQIEKAITRYWVSVKEDEPDNASLEKIENHAMRAACEAIQIAAMARKAMR